ncbi:MAG: MurR/RpiR family transcriptional regulator [Clostridia bacterium]|nr:MurR/RpiR family transcriptional regulator [Clostridia bacterium]
MSIQERINQNIGDMTKSERAAARHCLGRRGDFAFLTLDKLALEVGVSTASLIRFCQRIGFAGFKEFQEALRREVQAQSDLPDKYNRTRRVSGEAQFLTQTLRQDIQCMQETVASLDARAAGEAARLLSEAARVFTFGMKESFAMAHYAYTRLLAVRPDVYLLSTLGEGEVETLLSLSERDVCVVYLFHRYTRRAQRLLPLLKRSGARVILVTNPPLELPEKTADQVLFCRVDAGGIKNSFAAPVCLTDSLCGAVAYRLGDSALRHMQKAEEVFRASDLLEETGNGQDLE